MPALANVELTDTFDVWRIRGNQTLDALNTITTQVNTVTTNTTVSNTTYLGVDGVGGGAGTTDFSGTVTFANTTTVTSPLSVLRITGGSTGNYLRMLNGATGTVEFVTPNFSELAGTLADNDFAGVQTPATTGWVINGDMVLNANTVANNVLHVENAAKDTGLRIRATGDTTFYENFVANHQFGNTTAVHMHLSRVGGDLGLGTTTPGARLHLLDASAEVRIDASSGDPALRLSENGTSRVLMDYTVGTNAFVLNAAETGATVNIQAGGASRFFASQGNVNVGVAGMTTPQHELTLPDGGSLAIGNYQVIQDAGTNLYIGGFDATQNLSLVAGGVTDRLHVDTGGLVGINKTDGVERFEVGGAVAANGASAGVGTGTPRMLMEYTGAAGRIGTVTGTGSTALPVDILIGDTATHRFDTAQSLHIGSATNPAFTNFAQGIEITDGSSTGLRLERTSGTVIEMLADGTVGYLRTIGSNFLRLGTADTDRIYISGSNNAVGVACTTPTTTLDVTGDAAVSGHITGDILNQGNHAYPIPASAITVDTCAPHADFGTTGGRFYKALAFDAAADEHATFWMRMPTSWNEGAVTVRFLWSATSGSGNVVWRVRAQAIGNDDAATGTTSGGTNATDGFLLANDLHITPDMSITPAGTPAAGDMVLWQFSRLGTDVSDTFTVDALLLGVEILVNINASVDT